MKNACAAAALFVLWLLSMVFYMPLPVDVFLYAVFVAMATLAVWTAWLKRRGDRTVSVVKTDTKTLNWGGKTPKPG